LATRFLGPNNRHREVLEMDAAAPPVPRHRVVAALLMTLALGACRGRVASSEAAL
jgi:hypothetical protein